MAESTVQLQWAYSNKRQSSYATANPDVDINQSHPFEGADFADHTPNMSDNAALFGKGHEFATRNELLSWDVRFRRSFFATTKVLGWAFAFHTGTDTPTSLGGAPTAYSHVFEYQDPVGTGYYGSGRQQPVTTVVERVTSGLARKFPSCVVSAIEVTGSLNDWLRLAVEMIGSGKKVTLSPSDFTFPDTNDPATGGEGTLLRNAGLTFQEGPSGALVDISCQVRSYRFRSEMAYFENEGYCPGSGYNVDGDATSGQIRNKLEFSRRAVVLEFVVMADSTNHTFFDRLTSGSEVSALLTVEGAIISGANAHSWILSIPRMKYRAVQVGSDGDLVIWQMQTVVFYDTGIANPWTATVINDVAAYLVSS